ncbi:MAG TPA: glycosyltransferase family 39 protein [Candidatus Saccharimonadaceae bacterium]|jgi:4-amino-4-deoxy-L-arabinose transferase-like glycosyltransferase|nr:glycosyltransferase family 39 protein [Candidatus Saccharimonadaceae bacterium]
MRAGLALFGLALGLRLAYTWLAAGPHAAPYSDAADYDAIAWNLAGGHGFSMADAAGGFYPTAFRPPLVPWLTSLVYRAFGHRYLAALALQCAIGAVVPLLAAWYGSAVFGTGVGLAAGVLCAFDPLLVFFSGYLLTETAFTAAVLLGLLLTAQWIKTPRPGRALGVGLAWGVATLARPTALLLPALVAVWAWIPLGLTLAARDRVRQLLFVALGVALVVGPWTLRNAAVMHAFVPVTTGGGRAFLDSNNALVWGDPALRGGAESTYHLEPYAAHFQGLGEAAADREASRLAREFLAGHVAEWPAMAAAKLARFWRLSSEAGATGSWRSGDSRLGALTRVVDPLLFWSLLTLPLALWGAARVLSGPRRWFQSLALLTIGYFTLLAVVYWGALRTRVPIQPMVLLCSAVGFEDLRRRLRSRARGFKVIEGRRKAS